MNSQMIKRFKRHQYSKTYFKDKKIESLKNKMGWQGTGTKDDPIVINNLKGLKPNLIFQTSNLYYIIRDVCILKIHCITTQNITIENCRIYEFEAEGCFNMKIVNNSIIFMRLLYTRASVIENNEIMQESLIRLENNYSDVIMKRVYAILGFVFALNIFLVVFPLYSDISYWWLSAMFSGIVFLLIYVILSFIKKWMRTRHMAQNSINNNIILFNAIGIFEEIQKYYQNLKKNWFLYNLPSIIGGLIGGIIALVVIYVMYQI